MNEPNADRPSYCQDCGERITGGSHDCPGPDWQCPLCGRWSRSTQGVCDRITGWVKATDGVRDAIRCEGRKPE